MKYKLIEHLDKYFEEIQPLEFYRSLFPIGELEKKGEHIKGKYTAIAVEILPTAENKIKRYTITDELEQINTLLKSNNFIFLSPISYCGKSRAAENARYIYAIAIDLDGITEEKYINSFFYQIENDIIPRPTYIVASGTGLHLYYHLEKPLPCYAEYVRELSIIKKSITKRIWNAHTTSLSKNIQFESLFQGFRLVGGITKDGRRTRAFRTGEKVSINYLAEYAEEVISVLTKDEQIRIEKKRKQKTISIDEAATRFPEWYESRIIKGEKRRGWTANKALYNWWLDRIKAEFKIGHRYYCIMCLAAYAKKCGVSREELEKDAFSLLEPFDSKSETNENRFTETDIFAALEMYNDNYITLPIETITSLTNIPIQRNKRRGLSRKQNLELARKIKEFRILSGEEHAKGGRSTKQGIIVSWRKNNPKGTKAECVRETGVSKPTVYKYWNTEKQK